MEEIKSVLEAQAKAWHDFKVENERKLDAIAKNQSTADIEVKLTKINEALNNSAEQIKSLESKLARGAEEAKAASPADEHRSAFLRFLKRGDVAGLDGLKGMKVSDDQNGGYLVPDAVAGPLVQRVFDGSPIRQVARVLQISGNALEGVVDYGQLSTSWVDEVTASSDPTTPTLKKYRIEVNALRSSPRISQVLLEDASVDVEAWMADKIGRDFALTEQTAFVSGNGVSKPRGFASYTTAATADSSRAWGQLEHVNTGSNGSFGSNANGIDKLIDVVYKLKSGYRQGAVFMMSKLTLGAARALKTSGGDYIWQPNTQAGTPSQLLGYPVIEAEDMTAYTTTGALGIAFGNFQAGYTIVDRVGISILRDPYTNNPYVTYHAVKRVGGGVVDFDAIKFLRFSA